MRVTLRVSGEDAETWVQGQVTQDIRDMSSGELRYAFVVDLKGRVIADLWIAKDDGAAGLALFVPEPTLSMLLERFESQIIMEDVELQVDETLKAEVHHVPVWIESERILRGIPLFGVDFGTDHHPQETGLHRAAVSFNKGCYVGQEVVCMIEARGKPPRKMVQLVSHVPVEAGLEVFSGDQMVGTLSSITENGGHLIAIACLKRRATEDPVVLRTSRGPLTIDHIIDLERSDLT